MHDVIVVLSHTYSTHSISRFLSHIHRSHLTIKALKHAHGATCGLSWIRRDFSCVAVSLLYVFMASDGQRPQLHLAVALPVKSPTLWNEFVLEVFSSRPRCSRRRVSPQLQRERQRSGDAGRQTAAVPERLCFTSQSVSWRTNSRTASEIKNVKIKGLKNYFLHQSVVVQAGFSYRWRAVCFTGPFFLV